MEKLASTFMFPCKYFKSDCGAKLLNTEWRYHIEKLVNSDHTPVFAGASIANGKVSLKM
jgi:hypothetical protein